ncbi:glycoprotein [Vesiculovirus perinet]|uniref:Glycoprotein n=1 Tax=Vesiculovirus perinet TaxID=1972569 RepID=I1SV90_9RHAB|nr:glycoprotein [Vesiculovirus perinet]AEG25354.1 glycoprotein [Vesiculovirus perinet]
MSSKIVLAAICLCSVQYVACSFQIVFPEFNNAAWLPYLKTSRYCPQSAEMEFERRVSTTLLSADVPIGVTPTKSDGYLCHAAKWVTTCDFRWYGPKYVTHSIHDLTPAQVDCHEALARYKAGTLFNPGFPPASCGYATITDSEQKVVMITPHHVGIDDYRGKWIDPIFPGGECTTNYCETLHNSSVWLPADEKIVDICAQTFRKIKVTATYPSEGAVTKETISLHSAYHPHVPGTGICRMTYCSKEGLRLPNGEWLGIFYDNRIKTTDVRTVFPACPDGLEVKSTLNSDGANTIAWETQRMLDYALCQSTWDKVQNKEPLSAVDLSYLSARSPGKGLAYTVINGTLHFAHVRYVRTWIDGPVLKDLKGSRFDPTAAQKTLWDQWFPFGSNEIGPNGLLKTPKDFKFPLYIIGTGLVDEDLQELSEAGPIDHPQIPDASGILPNSEQVYYGDTGVSKNPIELIEGWFANWKETVMSIVGLVLLITIVFTVLKCIGTCRSLRRKRKIEKDIELQEIGPYQPTTYRPR